MLRAVLIAALLFLQITVFAEDTSTRETAASNSPVPATSIPPPAETAVAPGSAKIAYSQCHVEGPYIAMTFDDGPHAQNTPRLLEILKKRNIKATFFVVGQCAAEYPDLMKRIVAEGHEIGNHSWTHPVLSKMGEESVTSELQRTHDVIVQTAGVTPTLMRPPYGAFSPTQRSWANKKWGYKIILWDVDPLDWKYRNADRVHGEILKQTVAGSIVLSHDIHKTTVDAMPDTLDALANKGFKFVTVSELLAMDRPVPPRTKPGRTRPGESGPTSATTPAAAAPVEPASSPPATPSVPARK